MFKLRLGEIIDGESLELLPHQEEFLVRFLPQKVIGLFDEPGLGKTLEILSAICAVCITGDKALVVVPPHLVLNWVKEVEKFTYLEVGKEIDIVSYTQLGKKCTSFIGYKFVANDEGHYLKNMDAQRTFKFMTYLDSDVPEYFIHATGTPIANRIPEIYTLLLMFAGFEHVSPKIDVLYPTYYQFCERFCHVKTVSYGSGVKYHGMKNVDELKEYLKPWSIRRLADKVLTLPDMTNMKVIADYKENKELAKAWENHASTGDIGGIDIVAKKEAAIAIAPFTAKWVTDEIQSGGGPVVVFSDHRLSAQIIYDDLKAGKFRVGLIIGGQNMADRNKIVEDFQAGLLDAVVSTVGAGSSGITLTASNLLVVNDPPWVPKDLLQLRLRVRRLTQKRKSRCVYMVGSKASDQITQTLIAKMKIINAVVED